MPVTLSSPATTCLTEDMIARLAAGEVSTVATWQHYQHLLDCRSCANRCREHPAHSTWPTLDGYWLLDEIGRGEAGVVYKAWWRGRPERPVALKIVRPGTVEQQLRFAREVRVLSDLNCPNVVKCLDSGNDRAASYYAMDYIHGVPLDVYFHETATTLEAQLRVFERLCRAVAGPHERHVVHRDLKPANILVTQDGQPHVLDFGLCTVDSTAWDSIVRQTATGVGDIRGTIRYMPPEQAWGKLTGEANCKSDVWSLGIILYEVATGGQYPFDTTGTADRTPADALLDRIRNEPPRAPRITASEFAPGLRLLIDRCLAKEPSERLSALELADNIAAMLNHGRLSARRLSWLYRLRRLGAVMAVQQRPALWLTTVAATLMALSVVTQVFQVRWLVSGQDYDNDTRLPSFGGTAHDARHKVLIVGITDSSLAMVPGWAFQHGHSHVTRDFRTWRGIHAHILRRLATVAPRAITWDFFFSAPRPEDADLAEAINTLHRAGTPVVMGARQFDRDGKPNISPELQRRAAGSVTFGAIMARDMVERPGEIIVTVWRNGRGILSLALATVAAMIHPECDAEIEWTPRQLTMFMKYRDKSAQDRYLGNWDKLELTRAYQNTRTVHGAMPDDLLLCKAFELARPEVWEQRTLDYHLLLTCTDAELKQQCAGRIILFGNLTRPSFTNPGDRHAVRYENETLRNVPGCYLQADGIVGLLANRYFKPAFPISGGTYAAIIVSVIAGCSAIAMIARRWGRWLAERAVMLHIVLALTATALTAWLLSTRSSGGVQSAMLALAALVGTWASYWIESNRYRASAPMRSEP